MSLTKRVWSLRSKRNVLPSRDGILLRTDSESGIDSSRSCGAQGQPSVLRLSFSPAAIVQGWGQELAMETLALGLHLLPAGIYRVQPLFRLFLSIFQQRLQSMKSLPDTQSDHRSHQRRKHPATTEWNNLFNRDERGEQRCLISFLWHNSDGQTS